VEQLEAAQLVFVTRLRHYRQRAGISIGEVSAETRVRADLLDAFERNDLSAWPKGIFARAWVSAYASAVGLDPIDTANEFCRLFPQADPRALTTLEDLASIVNVPAPPGRLRTAKVAVAGVTRLLRTRVANLKQSRTALR
jgi:cytoskeleton protein RodZ